MDKVKVYRKAGRICLWLWVMGMIVGGILVFNKAAWRQYPLYFRLLTSFVLGIFSNCFYNPFLFIGAIFFWRASRNKVPPEKSGWFGFIVTYIILIVFAVLVALMTVRQYNEIRKRALQQRQDIETNKTK